MNFLNLRKNMKRALLSQATLRKRGDQCQVQVRRKGRTSSRPAGDPIRNSGDTLIVGIVGSVDQCLIRFDDSQ